MICAKLVSGLGNQLFQYAVGRHIALTTGSELCLDTSFFDSQTLRSYKLNHFNIKSAIATPEYVDSLLRVYYDNRLYARVFRKFEKLLPKYRHRYFKESEWWVYEPDLFRIASTVYLEGYWQHYRYFENLHPQVLDDLTLKEEYLPDAQLLQKISSEAAPVAIHIRRGDYLTDTDAANLMGILPLDYYQKAVAYFKEYTRNPVFYVFSDDLTWAYDHLRNLGSMTMVDVADGKQDYAELALMSSCQHNIIANSSFSWWGAFLNRNPDKIVIAPKKWVVPEAINQKIHLQFPSWIQL